MTDHFLNIRSNLSSNYFSSLNGVHLLLLLYRILALLFLWNDKSLLLKLIWLAFKVLRWNATKRRTTLIVVMVMMLMLESQWWGKRRYSHTHTPFWRAQRSMKAGGAFSTQKRNKLRQRLLSRNDFSFSNDETKNEDNNRDIVHRIELEMGNI